MPRKPTGQLVTRKNADNTITFAARFPAYGKRHYVTLGTTRRGMTRELAEVELENVLADVRRGIWRPPAPEPVAPTSAETDPTFHVFASEWMAMREGEGTLAPRTVDDYRYMLSHHLLPFFKDHRLSQITIREVDRYKGAKAAEGSLAANQINKTLTLFSQILSYAVEYELIAANPAAGKRRRLKSTKPNRPWVEPEQLMALLDATTGRDRVLLSLLAGGGLRIHEALALTWGRVDLGTGVLYVAKSKTDAGVREVHLTAALREELALWRAASTRIESDHLVVGTKHNTEMSQTNSRKRILLPAVERANHQLARVGIKPIGAVGFHSLRRTYASLRCACGDDVAYTSAQIGHADARFTLRVYVQATSRRDRLSGAHLRAFDRAIEWAQMGTNAEHALVVPDFSAAGGASKAA